ncbi:MULTISPECIES: APC family permease [Methylosinus]|uniref:APC family permease n=1 Tax=Methylosinus TaxID=425 RepID=UPI001FEE8F24|nr:MULTISPECIES: amino acid permease [Methylosinus]
MTKDIAAGGGAKRVALSAAAMLVVADMIGVGVFTSLGFQVKELGSPVAILALWLAGGVIAICGAFCYAELAAMFPRSSGEYNFLTRAFNPTAGFVAGWLSATVGFAAPVALTAMAFGQYAQPLAYGASPTLLGLGALWIVTIFHLSGVRRGGAFQIATTGLKIALILAFILAGFWTDGMGRLAEAPRLDDLDRIMSAPFAIGLVFVAYSYSGWNAATYIASEIRDPQRNLPKALFIGTGVVTLLYLGLNAAFLNSAPLAELSGRVDVAQVAANHIFAAQGGQIVGGLISLGLVSSISAMMWIGPRVAMVMGEDMPLLRVFAVRSADGAPRAAILLQLAVASLLLATQSFESALAFIQFSLTACSFLTVLGMVKLRFTNPETPRPYRAWGYPITPIIFLTATLYMMYFQLTTQPAQSLSGLLVMLCGLLFYAANSSRRATRIGVWAVLIACVIVIAAPRARAASANDNARILAGLSVASDSPLAPLTSQAGWKAHSHGFDAAFKRVEDRQLSKIRAWSKNNVPASPVLFYMFSGPDFLYANSFFPDASTYVLAGLEPVGQIPDLETLPRSGVDGALRALHASTQSALNLSFFITKDMKRQLRASRVGGALPVLYVFLARAGKTIESAELVGLDDAGELHSGEEAKGRVAGVKIVFSNPDGARKTLYFFSADVSDASFAKHGLQAFLDKQGAGSALLKSASYLLHSGNFSQVREFLLTRSVSIVEDDSGIPVASFGPDWRLDAYGRYSGPIAIFSKNYQARLARLHQTQGHRPLPFGIGYRWRQSDSNLLLAIKKRSENSETNAQKKAATP